METDQKMLEMMLNIIGDREVDFGENASIEDKRLESALRLLQKKKELFLSSEKIEKPIVKTRQQRILMKSYKKGIHFYQRGGDKTEIDTLKKAGKFFLNRLFTQEETEQLKIRVEIRTQGELVGEQIGQCLCVDATFRYPREYLITLKRDLDLNKKISTLGHELTHVKQYSREHLKCIYDDDMNIDIESSQWRGKIVKEADSEEEFDAYWILPWEIEARKEERRLFRLWKINVARNRI